jgi:hypothetical protein
MSFLPGWFPGALGSLRVRIDRRDEEVFQFTSPIPDRVSWTGADFGPAADDRIIAVALCAVGPISSLFPTPNITSATIGGISATVAAHVAIQDIGRLAVIYAAVPSGTSGNVVINFNISVGCVVEFLYRITGAAITPFATTSAGPVNTATDPTVLELDQTVVPGAGIIGIASIYHNQSSTGSFTWTGLSNPASLVSTSSEAGYRVTGSSAYDVRTTINGNIAVATSESSAISVRRQAIAVQWRP